MNITPDMWPADTEALRARIARLEAQSETRRLQIAYMKARIQAVRDVLAQDGADQWWVQEWGHHAIPFETIRRALDVSPD